MSEALTVLTVCVRLNQRSDGVSSCVSAAFSLEEPAQEGFMATTGSTSRLFVRNSTGLVRTASALDATIFNAVISAPIGSTLAWSIFFTLVAFPGADPVGVLVITLIINIPVLIMFALLGASMPRVGGDYVSGQPGPVAAAGADLQPVHDHGRPARRGVLRQVLLGLRGRPGPGRGGQPGPQQHADQLGDQLRDQPQLDDRRRAVHGPAADRDLDRRDQGNVPLAERRVPDRHDRHHRGVHRAGRGQPERLLRPLQ